MSKFTDQPFTEDNPRYETADSVRDIMEKMIELVNELVTVTQPYKDEVGYSVEVVRTNILSMIGAESYYNRMGCMDSIAADIEEYEADEEDEEDEYTPSDEETKRVFDHKSAQDKIKSTLVLSDSDMKTIHEALGGNGGGKKISAIKAYRQETGATLMVAKCAVEMFQDMPIYGPRRAFETS